MAVKNPHYRAKLASQTALARKSAKAQPWNKRSGENTMDQSLKSSGQSALQDAFHRMFELSRNTPMPTLKQRLDRLARLRQLRQY